ncbi:MAG: hypothetical protein ABIQ09_06155 [Jatrophihabitantaceae bacterium]
MLKKIVLAASAAVVVLGAGTAALATSGASSPSASTAPSASNAPSAPGKSTAPGAAAPDKAAPNGAARRAKAHKPALRALGRALHAEWVTPDRDNENAFVTHHAIRGEVTSVSATSITVKALDGVTQTYAVTSDTKVHLRKNVPGQGKGPANGGRGNGLGGGVAGSISDVHTGDKVAVTGTVTGSLTAQHIVDATE